MKLIDNWKAVLFSSWSTRLAFLAGVLSAVEVALPAFQDLIPPGTFAAISGVVAIGVIVMRLVAQPALHVDDAEKSEDHSA